MSERNARLKSVVRDVVVKSTGDAQKFIALEDIGSRSGRLLGDLEVKSAPDSLCHGPGDVLFGKLRPYLAKSYLPEAKATGSSELLVLRPYQDLDSRFLFYLTMSQPWIEWAVATSYGSKMPRTSWDSMAELRIWLPVLEEQRRIADFLDSETHQIDQIIAARLKWARLARDRWLTQIHDDISSVVVGQLPLKRVLIRPPQYGAQEPGDLGEAGWPRYIRITDLTEHGELREGDVKRLHPALARRYMLRDGDILLARSGATVGKGFRYRIGMGPACFAGYLIRIQADPSLVYSAYIDHWLRTEDYWSQIRNASVQSTIQNVNAERFASLLLPYASLDSQLAVIDRATRRKVEVDRAAAVAQRQVDLLAERRQALITAAVTGQIDVTTARGADV